MESGNGGGDENNTSMAGGPRKRGSAGTIYPMYIAPPGSESGGGGGGGTGSNGLGGGGMGLGSSGGGIGVGLGGGTPPLQAEPGGSFIRPGIVPDEVVGSAGVYALYSSAGAAAGNAALADLDSDEQGGLVRLASSHGSSSAGSEPLEDPLDEAVESLLFSPVEPLESLIVEELDELGRTLTNSDGASSTTEGSRRRMNLRRKLQLAAIVLALLAFSLAMILLPVQDMMKEMVESLEELVQTVGLFWSGLIFCLVYVVVVVTMLPAVVLTLAAGLIFGLVYGTAIVWTGMFLGCCSSFLIGRLLCREWVENMASGLTWFKLADDAIGLAGWKIVLLLRLSPLVPYNVLNYVLALTKISFTDYAWASFVGMFPGVLMFTYLGSVASDIFKGGTSGWYLVIGAFLTILSVVLMNVITAREVRKLMEQQRLDEIQRARDEQRSDPEMAIEEDDTLTITHS